MKSQTFTILILDDSREDREVYRRYLGQDSEYTYRIFESETAEEAFSICRESKPDLILLDYSLPDMDGLEFIGILRQLKGIGNPQILLLTGKGNEEVARAAMKYKIHNYLVKNQLNPVRFWTNIHEALEVINQSDQSLRTIAIVDDRIEDRETYKRYLQADSKYLYEFHTFDTGEEFLDWYQTNQPDVVLLDYSLPDMDGLEILQEIQESQKTDQLPVLMLTGFGSESLVVEAMKAGVQDYLVKGQLTAQKLCYAVDSVLEQAVLRSQIRNRQERDRLIGSIALRIRQSLNLQTILETTVEEVRQFLKCDRAIVYQLNSDLTGEVVAASAKSEFPSLLGWKMAEPCFYESSLVQLLQGYGRVINNIYEANLSDCNLQFHEYLQIKANLILPILLTPEVRQDQDKRQKLRREKQKGRDKKQDKEDSEKSPADPPIPSSSASRSPQLWGLLIAHQCATPRDWKDAEVELMRDLSIQIAIGIQQALLLEQLQEENLARRQTASALAESQARFKGMLEIAEEGIISVDQSQLIQLFNQGAEAIFGYQETEVLGQPIDILLPEASRHIHRQHIQNFATSKTRNSRMKGHDREIFGRRKNGEIFPIEASISQLELKNGLIFTVMLQDITERKEREAALAIYKKIVSASQEAMSFVDGNYIYRAVNPAYEQKFGLPISEIVGFSVAKIVGENRFQTTIKPYFDLALAGEEIHREEWFDFEDRDRKFLQISYYPHYESSEKISGVVVISRDITARKLAEEALERQLQQSHLLQEITEQIRQTLNTQNIFETAASRIGEAFGVNRCHIHSYIAIPQPKIPIVAEYLAGDFTSSLEEDIPVEENPFIQQVLAQEEAVIWNRVDPPCQKFHIKSILAVRTSYQGELNGLITIQQCDRHRQWTPDEIVLLEAVGARLGIAIAQAQLLEREKQQRQQLERQNQALEAATQAAEAANRAKSEFLANMSHEIRTPMNAILGFSELLQKLVTQPRQKSYLQSINASGKTLISLINDILDLSKIEAGKIELDYKPMNLRLLIKEIQQLFMQKASQKNLSILTDIQETIPTGIIFDGMRLRQILFNLIGNAIKFTEKGYIKISVGWERKGGGEEGIGSRRDRGDKQEQKYKEKFSPDSQFILTITIEDTGIGIAPEQQQKIFEAFVQSEGSMNRKYGGTGLGLTITQRLTHLLGGTIELKSQLGKGATFTVNFPQVSPANVEILEVEPVKVEGNLNHFQAATVLVVDDVQSNLDLIEGYFAETHHHLLLTHDGEIAIQLAETYHPDLILLDLWMPNMNGKDVANRLKQQESTQDIPILIITASIRREDEGLLKHLCRGFLRKPVSYSELVEALKPILPPIEQVEEFEGIEEAAQGEETEVERLPELLEKLRIEAETIFPQLQKTMKRRELRAFTQRLNQWASEHHCQILQEYGTILDNQIKAFDWKYLPETIKRFTQIREELELRSCTSFNNGRVGTPHAS